MRLVIGGYSQGKLSYVLRGQKEENYCVYEGRIPESEEIEELEKQKKVMIINHFHNWVKERIGQNGNPEEEIYFFLQKISDCIFICDEIGNGIVPIEAFEREYRERTGRILIELAAKADSVERVICGIGQKIK